MGHCTGSFGPPPPKTYFLILGRASSTINGLFVYPSLVDNDYTGEIKILVSFPHKTTTIQQGQRLAQALPLPFNIDFPSINDQVRGDTDPGSFDVFWAQKLSRERPTLRLKLNDKWFSGILDTGADATLISLTHWPSNWPSQPSITHLQGIGQSKNPHQSSSILKWEDDAGNQGTVQLFIIPGLPVNLWGRDVLTQMGVLMISPNKAGTNQMLSQGYLPGRGLGKNNQGGTQPISTQIKTDHFGFGYHPFPRGPLLNLHSKRNPLHGKAMRLSGLINGRSLSIS